MVALPAQAVIDADGKAAELSMELIKERIEGQLKQKKFKDLSSKRFAVLLPTDLMRRGFMDQVVQTFREEAAKIVPIRGHSLGGVQIGNFYILVKPEQKGGVSAGIMNERILVDTINEFIRGGPINVEFKGGGLTFLVEGVKKAQHVGRETGGGRKADVMLIGKSNVPISLKQDNAERWESVDGWYPIAGGRELLNKAEENGKVKIVRVGSVYQMRGVVSNTKVNVATKANTKEARKVVFGSDIISQQGAVIFKTFKNTDFVVSDDGSTLKIDATKIMKSHSALRPGDVWFLLTNSASRTGSGIRPGIRAEAVSSKRAASSRIIKI